MVTIQDAQSVTVDLVKLFNPVFVFLFGSVAQSGSGNDLDILIVIDEARAELIETSRKIERHLAPYYRRFPIDPFVVSLTNARQHLRNGSPFLNAIIDKGVLLYMQNAYEEWKKNAEEELAMARHLLNGAYYRGACFHAQQAIEKTLKARLLANGWQLEKTHSIRHLSALCEKHACIQNLKDDDMTIIESIYRGRYPAEAGLLPQGEPDKNDAERVIACAEKA